MTLVPILLFAGGTILIISALENTPIRDTFTAIISGNLKALPKSQTAPTAFHVPTATAGTPPPSTGPAQPPTTLL